MKSKHLCKHISLLLAILMLLPLFAFGVTAEEAEISAAQGALKAEADALAVKKADLVQGLEAASTIFDYVDKASFVEAGHVERLADEEELNSYVFRNPDGSKTVYFLAEDVKYVSVTGAVTEKKLELVALDGGYTTRSSNVSLALPNDLHRGITLAHGGATVSLAPDRSGLTESASVATSSLFAAVEELEQGLVSAPTGIAAGRADYQNAFGVGTTLRYTPTLSGVKEDVILDRYRGKNSFSFTLNTGNLSVFEENGRYFIAESAEAEEKIFIGETWVYDSQDHFEKGTLSVTQKAEGIYTLTIGASVDFLTSPDTVYPVYIDPSLTINSGNEYIEDVSVYSESANTNYGHYMYCYVGASSWGVGKTVVRLPGLYESAVFNSLGPGNIVSVRFIVKKLYGNSNQTLNVYGMTDYAWEEDELTWNELETMGYSDTPLQRSAVLGSSTATLDITELAKEWPYGAFYPDSGFVIEGANDTIIKSFYSSEHTTSANRPYIIMNYLPDSVYRIKNAHSGYYLKANDKINEGTSVYQDAYLNGNLSKLSQLWKVKGLNDGTLSIRPMHNPTMGLSVDGTRVEINTIGQSDTASHVANESKWQIELGSTGQFAIRPYTANNLALEIENASSAYQASAVVGHFDDYYPDLWAFEEVTDLTPGVLLYNTETGARINGVPEKYGVCENTYALNDLKLKAVYYSPTSILQRFSLHSSNTTVASVSNSRVQAVHDGTSTITISVVGNSSLTTTVSLEVLPLENAIYFLKNKEYNGYLQIDDDDTPNYTSSGSFVELWKSNGENHQRWQVESLNNGYYKIISVNSGLALSVKPNHVSDEDESLVQEAYLGYTRQQWKITSTESGGLRIKAKSAEGLEKDLVVTAGFTFGEIINWTDGVDVEQREYLDNDSYKDEWIFVRMLPTNGFELDYPSNASQYVQNCNNCYAYAINNQVFPGTNLLWGKQQMGEYSGSVYSDLTEEAIYDAVSNDYQKYNLDYMAGLSFERIGKYDVCSPGTYKVALVAGVGNNGTPDYHWYRQDSDGLWSHKQGTTPIKRTDYSGDVIIDPEYADRGGYTEFLGYYEVSPWSNLHNPTTSTVYCMGFLFTYDDWLRNLYA